MNTWAGYKFVGDNIDKNVKPRFQRQENRGMSLHHFHGYAIRDRLDLSSFSNQRPTYSCPDTAMLLPSASDMHLLKDDFSTLIARYDIVHP